MLKVVTVTVHLFFDLKLDNKSYTITYNMSGGKINNMTDYEREFDPGYRPCYKDAMEI